MQRTCVFGSGLAPHAGKLDRCFALAADRIPPGGLFAFSIETLDDKDDFSAAAAVAAAAAADAAGADAVGAGASAGASAAVAVKGFRLRRSGRYAHSWAYVEALAEGHGFKVVHRASVVVRTEQVPFFKK